MKLPDALKNFSVWHASVAAALIVAACLALNSTATMGALWYGPYLSGATNLEFGGEFHVDGDQIEEFVALSRDEQHTYHFTPSDNTEVYRGNPVGFVYIVKIATALFPWMSDINALEAFQITTHALISILVMAAFKDPRSRWLFFFVYAVNPVIIYFVTYPYYYYWQVIPSLLLVLLILAEGHAGGQTSDRLLFYSVLLVTVFSGIVLSARMTTLGAYLLFIILAYWKGAFGRKWLTLAVVLAASLYVIVTKPSDKNFYHTVYVGVGAYGNKYVDRLEDEVGWELYKEKYGEDMSPAWGGIYYESEVAERYTALTRDRVIDIAKESPMLFIKHAVLNTGQAFSLGYLTDKPDWVNYLMSLAGFVVAGVLLFFRQWTVVFAVLMTVSTFVLYYPPIPAYKFGAFLLLCVGAVRVVESFYRNARC